MADPQVTPQQAREIADAYCRARFVYRGPYADAGGRERHIAADVEATTFQVLSGLYPHLVAVYLAGAAAQRRERSEPPKEGL